MAMTHRKTWQSKNKPKKKNPKPNKQKKQPAHQLIQQHLFRIFLPSVGLWGRYEELTRAQPTITDQPDKCFTRYRQAARTGIETDIEGKSSAF